VVTTKLGRCGTTLALGLALLALAGATPSADAGATRRGGTFRILFRTGDFGGIDPALAYDGLSWTLLDTTCALLLRRQDLPPPAEFRPVPEAAARWPSVSADGKRYTFTIRSGFRFSDRSPLTARNFAAAIGRLRNPALRSPARELFAKEIVSARPVGPNRLVIRLSKRVPDFPARLTMPFFCPVPLGLPNDPEGVGAPFSGAGPYYVKSWDRDHELIAVRNPFYGGSRPQRVDRFVLRQTAVSDLNAGSGEVERGNTDWFWGAPVSVGIGVRDELVARYGVNRSQYFIQRAPATFFMHLNSARPLFKDNARLRRAVNFAVDRPAVLRVYGTRYGNATDQLLPPVMPGFRNAQLYPLNGLQLAKANELARGHTGNGKAVMYVNMTPFQPVVGAVIRNNLKQIGIDVEVKAFSSGDLFARLRTPGEPYDIAYTGGYATDHVDPGQFLSDVLDGRKAQEPDFIDFSHFNSRRYNAALDRANRLHADARLRALGELDAAVMRDEAPIVPLFARNDHLFVSKRVGCLVSANPFGGLNLGAVCLK